MKTGVMKVTDWWQVVFNPLTLPRFIHMMLGFLYLRGICNCQCMRALSIASSIHGICQKMFLIYLAFLADFSADPNIFWRHGWSQSA